MKTIFIILIVFGLINLINNKKSELFSLLIYENTFLKDTYNLTLLNSKDSKFSNSPSKLAYITDLDNLDSEIYNYYSKYFNRIWIFYISDLNQINKVLSKSIGNNILITGILMPKSLKYNITKKTIKIKKFQFLKFMMN